MEVRALALFMTRKARAEEARRGTEVCVNASGVEAFASLTDDQKEAIVLSRFESDRCQRWQEGVVSI